MTNCCKRTGGITQVAGADGKGIATQKRGLVSQTLSEQGTRGKCLAPVEMENVLWNLWKYGNWLQGARGTLTVVETSK